jgi:radical SAM superfamily enzyme YgiQ (UPF0313 family)
MEKRLKVLLIKASAPSDFKDYKAKRGSPSQNIFSTAAEIEDIAEVELIDETAGMKIDFQSDADIVGIFFSTPDAIRGYEIATRFQRANKMVFLGGLHVSFMSDEALEYASSVIIGESEGVIRELLSDFETTGNLKLKYQRKEILDLKELKPFPIDIINPKHYNYCWTVVASRGCPYKCHFCVVNPFFGNIRYRPIEHIVDEIKSSGLEYFELHADNLMVDKEWSKELFKAITPFNIKWAVATDISIAEDDEFLHLASKSGLNYVLIGLETPSQEALKGTGKGFVKVQEIKERIKKLHKYGIIVDSAMMFGFDEHDKTIFQRSLDFALDVGIDICEPVIQIPFPGTKLFDKLQKEDRILTYDWSRYNGTDVVYQPKLLTPQELLEGQEWFWYEFNSITNSAKRKLKQLSYLGTNMMYL